MRCWLILGALLPFFFGPGVDSFGYGAPECVDSPGHFADPQTSPSPYSVTLKSGGNGSYILTVGSDDPNAPKYKGILIMPKQPGTLMPINPPPSDRKFKMVDRNCDHPSWTHSKAWSSDAGSKSVWSFESGGGGAPSFTIHIVQQYTTFWTNVPVVNI